MSWLLLLLGIALGLDAAAEPRVHPDAESVQPLAVGASVPSVEVRDVRGTSFDLAELVREQGALLVFYRGGW